MAELRLSVTFLGGTYHGRGDTGRPEWPPSPMRLFQALLATAAARWGSPLPEEIGSALDWLATQPPPVIVAPPHHVGTPYQSSVPNNAMDIVAKAWARGSENSKDAQPATHKAMKEIRPTYLLTDDNAPGRVTYIWTLSQELDKAPGSQPDALVDLAGRLYQVGWGLDLVAGHGLVVNGNTAPLTGERWSPIASSSNQLRTPSAGARQHLEVRHAQFVDRLSANTLAPVPPLSPAAYNLTGYRRTTDTASPTVALFGFLQLDGSGYRPFAPTRSCAVAGMLRHAVSQMATNAGWSEQRIAQMVLGHAESKGAATHEPVGRDRFAYVPLPSLEPRKARGRAEHVGAIRRALIYVPANDRSTEIAALRRLLAGCELVSKQQQTEALITTLPATDRVLRHYVQSAHSWATVTPVILPGRDDRRPKKTENLLRKALRQAGYSADLVDYVQLDWRGVGYWPGAVRVDRHQIPKHLQAYPCYHVRIRWFSPTGDPLALAGPVVIGGGRYSGLGLFAAETETENDAKTQNHSVD